MKRLSLFILLLAFLTSASNGQSISVSPTSVPLWGKVPNTAKITASYKNFQAIGLLSYNSFDAKVDGKYIGKYHGSFIGLFWNPLNYKLWNLNISGGAGVFNRRFPTDKGQRLAFQLSVEYSITKHIGISWSHLSNGFELLNSVNPGVDSISISYHF